MPQMSPLPWLSVILMTIFTMITLFNSFYPMKNNLTKMKNISKTEKNLKW